LKTLNHENIVKFINVHEDADYLYFALELMEAGSLHKVMKRFGTFPEQLIGFYTAQALKGKRGKREKERKRKEKERERKDCINVFINVC